MNYIAEPNQDINIYMPITLKFNVNIVESGFQLFPPWWALFDTNALIN